MFKKIMIVLALGVLAGCLFGNKTFGMIQTSTSIIRFHGDVECAFVKGFDLDKITHKSINCVCAVKALWPDSPIASELFQHVGVVPMAKLFLTVEDACNSAIADDDVMKKHNQEQEQSPK